jgi:hypothetical protein
LEVKHTRNHLQAVLDPVIDFPEQDLMTIKRGLKLTLILLLLDGHSENVCSALKESDVIWAESLGATIDFQHAIRRAITLKNYVHRTSDAVLN